MKTKLGVRALGLLLVMALAGAVFVPGVSALIPHNTSGVWFDDFDYLLEPGDIPGENPDIKITPTKKISEEEVKLEKGLFILDTKRGIEYKEIDAEITQFTDEKMSLTMTDKEQKIDTKSLIPDVQMISGTFTWYWVKDTWVNHEITIHNYDSSEASGHVIFWSLEDGYGYGVPFTDLPAGSDQTVTIPFEVRDQASSVGLKPIAVEIKVEPTGLTSWAARMPFDAIEKYNNDASHLPDPNGGDNLEPSDLYHFPYNDGYSADKYLVLSEAALAVDNTNVPYESAFQAMQHVNEIMRYHNDSLHLHYIFSDLYLLNHPVNDKFEGVCDEYSVLYTSFTRALGIPTRFMAFTMVLPNGNSTGHAMAESWDGSVWVHSDPTLNKFDNPQIYKNDGNSHINITIYDDADDSYYTLDPQDPTGDGILKFEDFRTLVPLGEDPRYN